MIAAPLRMSMVSSWCCATTVMEPFGLSQPTISKHLKVLERAGLVAQRREAQRRPRTLIAAPLKDVDAWLEAYRQHWEQKFVGVDRYLDELQKGTKRKRRRGAR